MDKKKILIVEDEPDLVQMLKRRLESAGYAVHTAPDGQDGLEKAREVAPDLILLDVLMPGKDGYTMLRELRMVEGMRRVPVIVTTAKPGMGDLFKMEGVEDYLVKPYDEEELLARIKKITGETT